MKSNKRLISTGFSLIVLFFLMQGLTSFAQQPTATPVQISLPTNTPIEQELGVNQEIILATSTPAPILNTNVFLEAFDIANVRRLPATDEDQVGVIRAGETYQVIARHFNWYELLYDAAPSGVGWVFGDLVRVTGDQSVLPETDPFALSGEFFPLLSGSITPTPTGGLVATITPSIGSLNQEIQATFTYPAGLVRPAPTDPNIIIEPTPAPVITRTSSGGVPPIAPIILLGSLGLLGLLISSIRR